jgi:large subunit ribosomal protein L18
MARYKTREAKRRVRHYRIRKKVTGQAVRPRISVYRSLNHIYAQLIDDVGGRTLAMASDALPEIAARVGEGKGKVGRAKAVGIVLAEKAKALGISRACFDRGGYLYHGRVKALAEGAREGGLEV